MSRYGGIAGWVDFIFKQNTMREIKTIEDFKREKARRVTIICIVAGILGAIIGSLI